VSSPQAATNEVEVYQRLYKCGLTFIHQKQKSASEAEALRLRAEREEIERGKRLARALRHASGHQQMTRSEYEAFIKEQEGAATTEPKLPEEKLRAVYTRLAKQGKKKVDQEASEKLALKECTFHPLVNPSPSRGRSRKLLESSSGAASDGDGGGSSSCYPPPVRKRSPSCEKACLKLFEDAEKVRSGRSQLADRVDRERRLKLLKTRMNEDHHFLRRVQLDPTIAEAFMATLPSQV
jgi:hypothetical protein